MAIKNHQIATHDEVRTMRAPGTVIKRLPQLRAEDCGAAMRRASSEPWWPRVVNPRPVPSCGLWVWQVRT